MSSLKLNLSRQNPAQLIALADLVTSKLAPAAPATPPIPNLAPKVATLIAARNAADAANTKYEDAKSALVNLKTLRDNKADALRVEHTALASAVESEARGDAAVLTASGYTLAAGNTPSNAAPEKVMNLSITAGDDDGALDGQIDPTAGAKTYEVQVTTVDPLAGPWTTKAQPTASRWTLEGLASGQRVWVRVRGVGSNGPGPWSDPATKIVP